MAYHEFFPLKLGKILSAIIAMKIGTELICYLYNHDTALSLSIHKTNGLWYLEDPNTILE